ncbi:unnamed protein product [Prorocentrum cordatum]|uniref:Urea transporter n=1 Tax=Prorocentrum cordatum TaxID=2364126 RepID=A0ABN9VUI5_9DINO|nr:unnamed protein product [Polarella glacialis]
MHRACFGARRLLCTAGRGAGPRSPGVTGKARVAPAASPQLLRPPAAPPAWHGRPGVSRGAAAAAAASEAPAGASALPPLPPLVDQVLRGVGQVVFCNSPLSGGLLTAGLFYGGGPQLAVLALVGCTSATATARLAGADPEAIKNGLLGYNGALVGCAFSVFLGAAAEPTLVATGLGGAASALLASRLGALTAPVPQWTLAFNVTALALLLFVRPLADAGPAEEGEAAPAVAAASSLGPEEWLTSALVGVSQIFVVDSPAAGLLMLAGIAAYSPGAAAATALGSLLGIASAVAYGADAEEVRHGLWGFNPALTALAVSVFFAPVPWAPALALACGGALATAGAAAVLKAALAGALGVPALTLPFCAVASGCYLLAGRAPGLALAAAAHSPEANLRALRAAAR